jgi:hypothetical protein
MSPSIWAMWSVFGLLGSVAVLAIAVWLDPDPKGHGTHVQLGMAPCGYLAATGRPCLTCGMTTAFANLTRLRPLDAWRANPAGFVLFLVTLALPFWCGHALWTRRDPLRFVTHPYGRWILPAVLVVMVMVWVQRG